MSLLVVRLTKDGALAESKCCIVCLNILKAFGIDKVYYSTSKGDVVVEKVRDMLPTVVSSGLVKIIKTDPSNFLIMLVPTSILESIKATGRWVPPSPPRPGSGSGSGSGR